MIDVRPLPADAAADMARLHVQAFDAPWTETEIATLADSPGVFALGAAIDQILAGFILCRIAADEAEVLTLATAADRRRQGVGARLLETAGAAALAAGAEAMFLEVAADNTAALALYRSQAFRQVGLRPRYYPRAGGAASALIMRRDLNR